jgi:hypothetical protein
VTSDGNRAVLSAVAKSSAFSVTGRSPGAVEAAGTMIGHYKLLQKIGEGGSGVVYMAESVLIWIGVSVYPYCLRHLNKQ